jgi:hypothetical protein
MSDTPAVDEHTMKLGLLMETAQTQQELVDGSLQRLQAHTQGLDAVVREEIRRSVVAELAEVVQESTRAAQALRALRRAADLRALWWSAVMSCVPGAVAALLLWCWLPTPADIAALRAQHAQLSAAIARLNDSGARVQMRRCGEPARVCVRVDKRAPAYGEQADYLIVKGY